VCSFGVPPALTPQEERRRIDAEIEAAFRALNEALRELAALRLRLMQERAQTF